MTRPPSGQGPHLSAALLCEKVLEEKDGVKSAIRIIDRLTHSVFRPTPPVEMEPFDYQINLLIRFKSGRARGSHPLRISLEKPSGERPTPLEQHIYFEGEDDRGVDIVGNMTLRIDMTGIYWFHIYLSDVHLTQVPLRVIYMPQVTQMHAPGGEPPPGREPPSAS